MFRYVAAIAVVTGSIVGTAAAAERPGSVETHVANLIGEKIEGLAVTPTGRILVAGGPPAYPGADNRIRAYLPDGTPERGFGEGGTTHLHGSSREVMSMDVEPDGQILVGLSGVPPQLHRLSPDGDPDPSFAAGGTLNIDFGAANDSPTDVALQPDGRILVAGTLYGEVQTPKLVHLRRYLADGSPDPTFGANGLVELATGDPYVYHATLGLQPTGRIVVVVRSYRELPLKIARLSSDGVLDPSFGNGGLANVEFADAGRAARAHATQRYDWSPLILPDGRLRIPVRYDVPRERPYRMAVLGLTSDGHPDLPFGLRGLALGPRPQLPGGESPEVVVGDEHGGILVAGSLWSGADFTGDEAGVIRRFYRDGTPDRSFGRLGVARGVVPGGGYSVIEQKLAFLDGDTLVAAEHNYDGKYGFWGPAAVRTLYVGYDRDDPLISLVQSRCGVLKVRITDLSGLDEVVVRAGPRVLRRTHRKRFRVRLPRGTRHIAVRATDLAENVSTRRVRLPRC